MLSSEDLQLIDGCKSGKRQFQNLLYQRYFRRMFAVCLRYSNNQVEAEDILQEAFVKVFRSISSYTGNGSFEGWIKRIMINTSLTQYQKNKKMGISVDLEIVEPYLSDVDEKADQTGVATSLSADQLNGLIQKLPEGYKHVFSMYALDGFTHQEIADSLGININTSKSQLSKARRYLQKEIEKLTENTR
ncbi:MAG TPA: hypothetical protein DEO70_07470 [Bacteroidales bacterium]|nr:MAG: hypothetical protein A2X11_07090 [Bacteroidetes bacterium GWE2_42_24]OFY25931.1 MAG: hypothetical protein A2X09_04505 [Bacteroidetes bacterium GWF2_43_11]PKP27458.1 MAG: hypothetical protein CVU06_01985 [Bacteroidetes bacterium HGW-Bacteroidetes-22]HBZ66661.1 hypothetical protein [Bacteroidales bacterium]